MPSSNPGLRDVLRFVLPSLSGEEGDKSEKLKAAERALNALVVDANVRARVALVHELSDYLTDPTVKKSWPATDLTLTTLFDLCTTLPAAHANDAIITFQGLFAGAYHGATTIKGATYLARLVQFRHDREGTFEICQALLAGLIHQDLASGSNLELAIVRLGQAIRYLSGWSGLLCPTLKETKDSVMPARGTRAPLEGIILSPQWDETVNEAIREHLRDVLRVSTPKHVASFQRFATLHALAYPRPVPNQEPCVPENALHLWLLDCRMQKAWPSLDLETLYLLRWNRNEMESAARLASAERLFTSAFGKTPMEIVVAEKRKPTPMSEYWKRSPFGHVHRQGVSLVNPTRYETYLVDQLSHGRWADMLKLTIGTGWSGLFGPTLEDHRQMTRKAVHVTQAIIHLGCYLVPAMYKASNEGREGEAAGIAFWLLNNDARMTERNMATHSIFCQVAKKCLAQETGGHPVDTAHNPGKERMFELSKELLDDANDITFNAVQARVAIEFDHF